MSVRKLTVLIFGLLIQAAAYGASHQGHNMHDHSMMGGDANQAMGSGVLHQVDADKKMVNLTHQPIPTLNWPEMTMDLPVTKRVDLTRFKAGDQVHFTLKKGRDNHFRIISMEPHQ
ncbi:MAG: copper-binding protein [Candidatus Thiodiazotropha lotti]|uniref:copper-binding protein n=1 Tax=Candidatus Thiodiazotropha endoloripes TaxID=1818881 RepID=UPI00083DDCE4|nr:copper-binding protein [Candidatus Thiodiazotropha endoloripes]MCG7902879.1 copper-binding protein [Candidatus Thiodiazotropha weberae]MCG7991369.1 copper-binding protein [Candidatus Thiodiazotropha lotti]MCG7912560.1 copper-binding protein [Candidatus Thiodiazotropha weberae]MCG8001081.1 copper-binding protein [Candidatus Thiodiazotropha lotti]MCW4183024.1 copper-binding protein [Candidatus Thiodiazotropha weberae]